MRTEDDFVHTYMRKWELMKAGAKYEVCTQVAFERKYAVCCLILGEVSVLESEIALLPLAPRAFPVEVDIYTLFVILGDRLWFRMSLEPR